jgi:flagellar basal body-associated protein FliL
MWPSAIVLIILALVVGIVGAIALGSYRWHLATQELRANLESARSPIKPLTVDAETFISGILDHPSLPA